jgi:hypothetical protein
MKKIFVLFFIAFFIPQKSEAQHSVAREWNEALLTAIRKDFARPTVHARNLFHISAAMYDAWAAYDQTANTYFIAKPENIQNNISGEQELLSARNTAISYAAYRLLKYRFRYSPGAAISLPLFDSLMVTFEYDTADTNTDFSSNSPAALGNYIADYIINFGLTDGANEIYNYGNLYYEPVNPAMDPVQHGDMNIIDPNRWQPLTLGTFIDQSGNQIPIRTPEFLGAEWGEVKGFALTEDDLNVYHRDGYNYYVFHDPGAPPYLDTTAVGGISEEYKWSFSLVSIWSSHLDPTSGDSIDISPASLGNNTSLPETIEGYRDFYNYLGGGDGGTGRPLNPVTGVPYEPQIVPLGDYTRVLAEFWADGPESETPPGHWFTILNYVSDHPLFEKRFKGTGPVVDELEWDIKAYFLLGGSVHDAAVTAWGIKGWYDYIRPISAIRCMADFGQSSDSTLPNYHPAGIPLVDGFIELVTANDTMFINDSVNNIGKIKLYTWRGHDFIENPETDIAGAGWILAENWWPYQRPTFVTPPFAGFISGHSTFSRTAAEVMTLLTGDEYFPGGMGEFFCPQNDFLVFEEGPSMDITLQWATYRDASDQTSLSRIWGGIHPPADDIPGRRIGIELGHNAFALAEQYFNGAITQIKHQPIMAGDYQLKQNYPNPFNPQTRIEFSLKKAGHTQLTIYNSLGRQIAQLINEDKSSGNYTIDFNAAGLSSGIYFYKLHSGSFTQTRRMVIIK